LATISMDSLVRHRRSKVAETDRLILTVQLPVLYSTLNYYNKYDRENNKTITVNPVSNYLIQNYLKLPFLTLGKINKKLKEMLDSIF